MNLLLFSAVVLAISCDPFVFPPVPAEFITETDAQVVCVSTRLSHCQNKFADALNMPEGSSWSDPNQMGQTLAILYTSGVSGLIKTCNARQQFQECLGDTYTACMSVPRFVAAGESPLNAVQYTQIFNALEFDCNGGFVQASSNWPCILGVWTTSANDLENCFNTFNATVAANPTQVCAATYKYETCTRQLFGYGCNAEASWWMCERTRVALQLDQWCPASFCPVIQYKQKPAEAPLTASRIEGLKRIMRGNEADNTVRRMIAQKNMLKAKKLL